MKESNFKFSNPIIEELNYTLNSNFDINKKPSVYNNFKVNIFRNESSNEAIVKLKILINDEIHNESNSPFVLAMTIGSRFTWSDVYDESTINNLLSVNAPALLLGYARPIIATITSNSLSHPYNIPFYNFINE